MWTAEWHTYCENTTLHGFKYLYKTKFDRWFWIFSLLFVFCLTHELSKSLIESLKKSSVIIYTSDEAVPVTDIDFPAVSICQGIILSTDAPNDYLLDYTDIVEDLESGEIDISNLTEHELKIMQVIGLVGRDRVLSQYNLTIDTTDFIDIVHEFPQIFNFEPGVGGNERHYVHYLVGNWSQWHKTRWREVLYKTGPCYTFNFPELGDFYKLKVTSQKLINISVFDLGETYSESIQNTNESLRYPLKGPKNMKGLQCKLRTNVDRDVRGRLYDNEYLFEEMCPNDEREGYHLKFHGPFEIVSDHAAYFYSRTDETVFFEVVPEVFDYDESLRELTIEERNCFFDGEKSLKFFKTYNVPNCEHECISNLTLKACGCVQFFMIRDSSTSICGVQDENCFSKVEDSFVNDVEFCNCMQPCQSINYNVRIKAGGSQNLEDTENRFHVDFKVSRVFPQMKSKKHSTLDVLAFFGGMFGLLSGFSFISAIEIIYIFVLKPFYSLMKRKHFSIFHRLRSKVHPFADLKDQKPSFFKRYLQESSVHSLNYIANEESFVEKLFWFSVLAVSIVGLQLMASSTIAMFHSNRILLAIDSNALHPEQIPFPAITLSSPYDQSREFFELERAVVGAEFFELFSFLETVKFDIGLTIETYNNLRTNVEHAICFDEPQFGLGRNNFTFKKSSAFVEHLKAFSEDQRKWIKYFYFKWQNAAPELAEIVTRNGLSYTFNMKDAEKLLDLTHLSRDFGYEYQNRSSEWPQNAPSLENDGFEGILIDNKKYYNKRCRLNAFNVHPQDELPIADNFVEFDYGSHYEILMTPEVIITDSSLRSWSPLNRGCFYAEERKLQYFKVYTEKMCEIECLSYIVYQNCKCVPFFMLRNDSMELCDINRNQCAMKFLSITFDDYKHLYESVGKCNCLPACERVTYDYELIRSDYTEDYKTTDETSLIFKFKGNEFFPLLRYQQFGLIDFLSFMGGLLGLFAGVSVLSIIELVYFFVLRLATDTIRSAQSVTL